MLLMVAASGAKAMPRFADLLCEDVETGAQGKPVVVTMLAPMWKLSKMDGIVSSFPLMMRLSFRRHHDSSRPRMQWERNVPGAPTISAWSDGWRKRSRLWPVDAIAIKSTDQQE